MKIWIDADACPRVIKDIVFRASERLQVPVCLVANKDLSKAHSGLVTSVLVADGFDIADDYIAEQVTAEDQIKLARGKIWRCGIHHLKGYRLACGVGFGASLVDHCRRKVNPCHRMAQLSQHKAQ